MEIGLSPDELLDDLEARGLKLRGRVPSDYLTIDELLVTLGERGLAVGPSQPASHYLRTIGHHRLSTFYPSFYEDEKKFFNETAIEDVFHLYSFDRRLRLMLLGPLEKIEVALRALLIKELGDFLQKHTGETQIKSLFDYRFYDLPGKKLPGEKYSTNENNYRRAQKSCRSGALAHWNAWFPRAKRRNSELKIDDWKHAFDAYYKTVPAWTVLQTASFSPLTLIYATVHKEISIKISEHFRLAARTLKPSFFALKELRNACAHHEPVWNWSAEERAVELPFPNRYREAAGVTEANELTLYPYCALIHILLSFLSHGQSTWHRRLKKLVNEFDTLYGQRMGFPENWQTMPFWCVQDVARTAMFADLRQRVGRGTAPK